MQTPGPTKVAVGAVTVLALALFSAPITTSTAATHDHLGNDSVRLHAASGFPHAEGRVEWHAKRDTHHADPDQEFDLVLRGVPKLEGKRLRVVVNGSLVGRHRVNDAGRAHLHRHAGMHTMHDGWRIRVRTPSGALVAKARFHHDDHHGGGGNHH